MPDSALSLNGIDHYSDAYWATWFNGNVSDLQPSQVLSDEIVEMIPTVKGLEQYLGLFG